MRHPLSTSIRSGSVGEWVECAVAVGDVDGLVVGDAALEAVPEHFEPAVAERAEGGVVAFARGPL
jgi:hypothetical protein